MIHVIATVQVQPGRRTDFLKEFQQVVPLVLQESGCIEYVPTIDAATEIPAQGDLRENVVVIIEKWASLDALEDHLIAPHMLEYRKRVKEMVAGSSIQVLEPA